MPGKGTTIVPARLSGASFLAGAVLALVTSGGILEERVSAGSVHVGAAVNAVVTFAAIATLGLLHRRAPLVSRVIVPQAMGATVGVLGIHLALRWGWLVGAPWLAEGPAQLVNDAVAVFGTLAVVWACANHLDLRLLVVALVVTSVYRATGTYWHLDAAPRGFLVPVQDLVIAQLVCAALALPLYQRMTRDDLAR
jgi:hypothetical protein